MVVCVCRLVCEGRWALVNDRVQGERVHAMSLTVSFFDAYVLLLPLAARDEDTRQHHSPALFPAVVSKQFCFCFSLFFLTS